MKAYPRLPTLGVEFTLAMWSYRWKFKKLTGDKPFRLQVMVGMELLGEMDPNHDLKARPISGLFEQIITYFVLRGQYFIINKIPVD